MSITNQNQYPKRVWITWETQRRSINLSQKVGAKLMAFDDEKWGFMRYPISALKTIAVLLKSRGRLVFVQFPSIFLAVLACFLRPLFRYILIVDRHTDFSMELSPPYSWKEKLVLFLSTYTLRNADITLVTNPEVATRIASQVRRTFILPDPIPDLPISPWQTPASPLEIMFVSTWAVDEPILEVMEACRSLRGLVNVHITGRRNKRFAQALLEAPRNFIPTGFLSDPDYFKLMSRMDCVIAITTRPATLVCGAYEAISMGKPLVLGDSKVLREYFYAGAVYTNGTVADITCKLKELPARLPALREEILQYREQIWAAWEQRLSDLNKVLEEIELP